MVFVPIERCIKFCEGEDIRRRLVLSARLFVPGIAKARSDWTVAFPCEAQLQLCKAPKLRSSSSKTTYCHTHALQTTGLSRVLEEAC